MLRCLCVERGERERERDRWVYSNKKIQAPFNSWHYNHNRIVGVSFRKSYSWTHALTKRGGCCYLLWYYGVNYEGYEKRKSTLTRLPNHRCSREDRRVSGKERISIATLENINFRDHNVITFLCSCTKGAPKTVTIQSPSWNQPLNKLI